MKRFSGGFLTAWDKRWPPRTVKPRWDSRTGPYVHVLVQPTQYRELRLRRGQKVSLGCYLLYLANRVGVGLIARKRLA